VNNFSRRAQRRSDKKYFLWLCFPLRETKIFLASFAPSRETKSAILVL